jgi:hypothetical protein
LENQIDNFEAEVEGLSIKKGKQRPPRLVHLEKSITRHKAHIKKLESILRLLDNDELSPEQVNDVKDFLDDYVERNQVWLYSYLFVSIFSSDLVYCYVRRTHSYYVSTLFKSRKILMNLVMWKSSIAHYLWRRLKH